MQPELHYVRKVATLHSPNIQSIGLLPLPQNLRHGCRLKFVLCSFRCSPQVASL